MSGLEKILSQITSEAQAAADETLNKARAEADEILAQAQQDTEAACQRIAARAERDEKDALDRAQSAAALKKRQALLAAKQELIGTAMAQAHQTLCALPDKEYFEAVQKLALRFAHPGQGVIYFNQKDLARLPAGFEAALAKALGPERTLALSSESRPIDGGFVLAYGGVEENCSFGALFHADRETLQDRVQALLFA